MAGFDWDDANRTHIARHGVTVSEAEEASMSHTLDIDSYPVDDELRFEDVGITLAGRILQIVTVDRAGKNTRRHGLRRPSCVTKTIPENHGGPYMKKKSEIPAFASEAEEANWWFEMREQHAAEYMEKHGNAPVRTGRLARRVAEAQGFTPISLDSQDISNAKQLAEQCGMDVTDYLTMLVHEALQQKLQNAA